jgi:hypothetical protein
LEGTSWECAIATPVARIVRTKILRSTCAFLRLRSVTVIALDFDDECSSEANSLAQTLA